jgi:hypothetical protein
MPCKPKLVPARDDDRREPANGLIAHSEASFVAGTLRCAARLVRGTIKTHGSESNPRRISDRVSIRRGLAPEPRKKIQTRIVVRRSTQMTADRIRSDQIRSDLRSEDCQSLSGQEFCSPRTSRGGLSRSLTHTSFSCVSSFSWLRIF